MSTHVIDKFEGDYYFLSNFYPIPMIYQGVEFANSEAAFHAQKCVERREEFTHLTPSDAKKLGRQVQLREDWEHVKDQIMLEIVRNKFIQHPSLEEALINTGDAELIEGNWWHDTYWGVCNGVGQNKLGKILMRVRAELTDLSVAKE